MAKNNDSLNFDSVIKNLSPDTKVSNTPWFKKKASIIAMGSTLGVAGLATVIAVPVALTTGSTTSSETTPPTIDPLVAIAAFNNKSTSQKIDLYNSIMKNPTNNTAIKNYLTQVNSGGMTKFINTNVATPTDSTTVSIFDEIKTLLATNWIPANTIGGEFLTIKGIKSTVNSVTNNNNATSRYILHAITLPINAAGVFSFFSPIKTTIIDVTMTNDFSIVMTLPNDQSNIAFAFKDQYANDKLMYYKQTITFSNQTLFPGMSDFVKKSILNLTA